MFNYEKCITCPKIGESCVPNLTRLQFPDLIQWCIKRQKYRNWTNQMLADRSTVPVGTINRIKAGEYLDCKYSTIRNLLLALVGGTIDDFPCNAQIEKELEQMELLEQQAAKLLAAEEENRVLKQRLSVLDELHRGDIRAVTAEYKEQIEFLKDELKAWRSLHKT